MQRLSDSYGRFLDVLALVAAGIVLAMVGLISLDVALRNLFSTGIAWSNEITEYALYVTALFAAPWLLRQGQHVRIDMIVRLVPPYAGWVMEWIADLLGFAVSVCIAWYGVGITLDSQRMNSLSIKTLVFPEWWLLAPLPVAFILIAVEFVFRMHRLKTGAKAPRAEATSLS